MGNKLESAAAQDGSSRRFLNVLITVSVVAALGAAPSQYSLIGGEGRPHITPADLLIALAAVLWLLEVFLYRGFHDVALPPVSMIAYVIWAVIVSAVAIAADAHARLSAKEVLQLTGYFLVAAILFADTFRSASRLHIAVYVIMAAGSIVVIHGLIQGFRGPLLRTSTPDQIQAVCALFVNNHVLSAYLAVLTPFCVAILLLSGSTPLRVWATSLAVASLFLIFNGPLLLAAIVSAVAVGVLSGRRRAAAVIVATLALTMIVLPLASSGRGSHLVASVSFYSKWGREVILSYRYRRWQAGINIFRAHPFFGIGPGQFQEHVGKMKYHMLEDGMTPTPTPPENITASRQFVDNRYILTVAELGFPGLVLLLWIFAQSIRASITAYARAVDPLSKALFAGCLGITLAVLLGNVFTDFLVRGLALPLVFALTVPAREG